jgi:hypothetical protein
VKICDDADPTNDKGCPMAVTGVVVIGNISFSGQDAMLVSSDGMAETPGRTRLAPFGEVAVLLGSVPGWPST